MPETFQERCRATFWTCSRDLRQAFVFELHGLELELRQVLVGMVEAGDAGQRVPGHHLTRDALGLLEHGVP